MLIRTLPGRIILGFATLLLLTVLLGAISLWRVFDINGIVANLATNSVTSVVTLNRIAQSRYETRGAVRRLLLASAQTAATGVDDADFLAAKAAGDSQCAEYAKLLSDAEEERLFTVATASREQALLQLGRVVAALREGRNDDAHAIMSEADSRFETANKAFNDCLDHNCRLVERQMERAERNVTTGFRLIGGMLALAAVLGTLLGAGIIRGARRSLGDISDALEASASQTSMASGQLASASHSLAEGCSEQGSAVAETSAALEQMSAMIRGTADNAEKAKGFAGQASAAAGTGAGTMAEMNEAMRSIETSSAEVAKIVKDIDEIAFQTNILALNAAVEAARAGEAGAGFAVVADEVRSLAQRSAAAARETAGKIDAAITNSRRGSASCERVGESLQEIVRKVAAADALVAEIATAAKEQAQGIRQVGTAMTEMDKVTQGNATSAEESASAAEELRAQALSMQGTVDLLRRLVGRQPAATGKATGGRRASPTAIGTRPPPALPRRAPANGMRSRDRIPMPKDAAPATAAVDHEDKHFTNF